MPQRGEQLVEEWERGVVDDDGLRAAVRRGEVDAASLATRIFAHAQSSSPPTTLTLFRLLRDVTTNEEAQSAAMSSGCLVRALELLFDDKDDEEDAARAAAALMFVSNCIAGTNSRQLKEQRALVWERLDVAKAIEIHAAAASLILHLLLVVDDDDDDDSVSRRMHQLLDADDGVKAWSSLLNVCVKEQCARWVVLRAADTCCDHALVHATASQIVQAIDVAGHDDDDNNDDEDDHFPWNFALRVLPAQCDEARDKAQDVELLVKMAQWTSRTAVPDPELGRILIQYCAARLAAVVSSNAPEPASTQCLQVIANVLGRGPPELKDFAREVGAVKTILHFTRIINPKYPTLREWALFAFRACCEGNAATHAYVHQLQHQPLPPTTPLQ